MNEMQAALGISQLRRLSKIVEVRNKQRDKYRQKLKGEAIELLEIPSDVKSSVHLVVVRLLNSDAKNHRKIFEKLREDGIGIQLHYEPVHLQPYYRKLGFKEGDYEESENYARSAFSIPVFPGLKDEEHQYICEKIKGLI